MLLERIMILHVLYIYTNKLIQTLVKMNGNVYSKYFDLTLKLITISTFTPKYFTQIDMEKKKDTKLDHNIKTKARVLK